MNGNIEILSLDIMEGIDMLLWWISSFFSCKVESDDPSLSKVDRKLRHFHRSSHVSHRTNNQPIFYAKIFPASLQPFQYRRNNLFPVQTSLRMEKGGEACFNVYDPVV